MNPDLSRQIAERLSKLHDGQVEVAQPATTIQMTSGTHDDLITLSANGHSGVELSSMYHGTIPGEMQVLTANGGSKTAFDVTVGDQFMVSAPLSLDTQTSFAHAGLTTLAASQLAGQMPLPENAVTLRPVEEGDSITDAEVSDELAGADEVDTEFWKSLGMNGPEDMTPDKLAEISKKLQEFGRNLKRMQREIPTTMGVPVRIKHRSPKKRKRKH